MFLKLKVLVAPLDWGLGHTTRCLPVINYLQLKGHTVVAAAHGAAAKLLKENFPGLEIIPLPGYNIRYSSHKNTFAAKILLQIPKILAAIRREKAWLKVIQQKHSFDFIISDNRYGLYLEQVPCIIMTHQLAIQSGMGNLTNAALRRLHYRLLNRFTECWIVDKPGDGGLSGALGHPPVLPEQGRYIGFLSQLALFSPEGKRRDQNTKEILVLLSGPEPSRGIFEQVLLEQVKEAFSNYHFTFVAGNPLGTMPETLPENVRYYTHLNAKDLKMVIDQADLVVCRSGYSSLMDLAVLNKKALLIPTEGQTEQEYLAKYLREKGWFYYERQKDLLLFEAITHAFQYDGITEPVFDPHDLMKNAVDELIDKYFGKN